MPLNYTTNLGAFDNFKNNMAMHFRRRVFEFFMKECAPRPDSLVADFGVSGHRGHPVHYFFETMYPYKDRMTALGRKEEGAEWMTDEFPGLTFLECDLREIPRPDGYFDCGICNAVLEHAGPSDQQRKLVHEVCRTCKRVLFTTPNRGFPLEIHTFLPFVHWLDDPLRGSILRMLGREYFSRVENLNLLYADEFLALFPPQRANRLFKVGFGPSLTHLVCVSIASDP